eukprot:TRINITY_DN85424_c0_g1_i1.p1 TRINITY_DN85424_c0_g1~~TRINITY_DN85424_c0_g1_i1.p1  ORF type:complete len:444 (-),score=27.92 TRINITY_DN85424_c0_g1_i1:43-1374(-)
MESVRLEDAGAPVRSGQATVLYQNKMYMFAGLANEDETKMLRHPLGEFLNDVWMCSWTPEPTWSQIDVYNAEEMAEVFGHTCTLSGSTVILMGGQGDRFVSGQVVSMDLAAGTNLRWVVHHKHNSVFRERWGHSCVLDSDGRLVVFGGSGDHDTYNDTMIYDPNTHEFEEVFCQGNIPSVRRRHCAHVYDNKMWVFGGRRGTVPNGSFLNDLWYLDLSTRTWHMVHPIYDYPYAGLTAYTTPMQDGGPIGPTTRIQNNPLELWPAAPGPRTGACSWLWKDEMFVFSGFDWRAIAEQTTQYVLYNDLWKLHLPSGTWTPLGFLQTRNTAWRPPDETGAELEVPLNEVLPRSMAGCQQMQGPVVYIFGGRNHVGAIPEVLVVELTRADSLLELVLKFILENGIDVDFNSLPPTLSERLQALLEDGPSKWALKALVANRRKGSPSP